MVRGARWGLPCAVLLSSGSVGRPWGNVFREPQYRDGAALLPAAGGVRLSESASGAGVVGGRSATMEAAMIGPVGPGRYRRAWRRRVAHT